MFPLIIFHVLAGNTMIMDPVILAFSHVLSGSMLVVTLRPLFQLFDV